EGYRVQPPQVEFEERVRGLNRTRAPSLARMPSLNGAAFVFSLKVRDRPDSAAPYIRARRIEQEDEVVYLAALIRVRGRVAPSGLDAPEERVEPRAQLFGRHVPREVIVRAEVCGGAAAAHRSWRRTARRAPSFRCRLTRSSFGD